MAREAKPHISLRVEADTAARVMALKQPDETTTAAYNRVLAAGVEALTAKPEPDTQAADAALIAALQKSVDTLTAQLDVKDAQIKNLGENLRAAQMLHAQAAQYKPIEAAEWPTTAQEKPQETRQAAEWVDTAQQTEPAPQQVHSTPMPAPRRGGFLGAIGRAVFGSR